MVEAIDLVRNANENRREKGRRDSCSRGLCLTICVVVCSTHLATWHTKRLRVPRWDSLGLTT